MFWFLENGDKIVSGDMKNLICYCNYWMDYPDFEGISDIQETEIMTGSRVSTRMSPRNHIGFTYTNPVNFGSGLSFPSEIENSNISNEPSFFSCR